jgi:hypothetical protein
MKRLMLLVLLLFGFYVVWPGYSGYQIRNALEAKDATALAEKVDIASVKESLRPFATAEAERTVAEMLEKSKAGVLGPDIAKKVLPRLIDLSLDALVTPESIIRIYAEHGAVKEAVGRMVRDQLGRSGGIAGLGAALSGTPPGNTGRVTGAVEGLARAGGARNPVSTVPTVTTPTVNIPIHSPVRTVGAPEQGPAAAAEVKRGYGLSNIKRLGPSGPLSIEIGVAKDSSAAEADVVAEMSFTGTDWKLTGLKPRL